LQINVQAAFGVSTVVLVANLVHAKKKTGAVQGHHSGLGYSAPRQYGIPLAWVFYSGFSVVETYFFA
jgi:hypothetical protein